MPIPLLAPLDQCLTQRSVSIFLGGPCRSNMANLADMCMCCLRWHAAQEASALRVSRADCAVNATSAEQGAVDLNSLAVKPRGEWASLGLLTS